MVNAQKERSSPEAKALRKRGGQYLRGIREAVGLTQRELANDVGLPYYTFISQIENGNGRPPPDLYQKWAEACGVDIAEFTWQMLKYYDPWVYQCLKGRKDS